MLSINAATAIVEGLLARDADDEGAQMFRDIVEFSHTTAVARAVTRDVLLRLHHERTRDGIFPWCEVSWSETSELFIMAHISALWTLAAFAIYPGLMRDTLFIEHLLIEAVKTDNIEVVRFIHSEVIPQNPTTYWSVARYLVLHNAHRHHCGGVEMAHLLFDSLMLDSSYCLINSTGVLGFVTHLITNAESDGEVQQPDTDVLRVIVDACVKVTRTYSLAHEYASQEIFSGLPYLHKYDCCDEILRIIGKKSILLRGISRKLASCAKFDPIIRQFVVDDPSIVDGPVKQCWALECLRSVSSGSCITDDAEYLGIQAAERAQLLTREFISWNVLEQGEYSRITHNIARELRRIARDNPRSFRIDRAFMHFAIDCAMNCTINPHFYNQRIACANACDLCCALGLLERVARDSRLFIYRPKSPD